MGLSCTLLMSATLSGLYTWSPVSDPEFPEAVVARASSWLPSRAGS